MTYPKSRCRQVVKPGLKSTCLSANPYASSHHAYTFAWLHRPRQHTEGLSACHCFPKALILPGVSGSLIATASGSVTNKTPNRKIPILTSGQPHSYHLRDLGFHSLNNDLLSASHIQITWRLGEAKDKDSGLFLLAPMPDFSSLL